ncbi:MAG TPA: hypothetical protein VF057_07690 [Thermoanaerobaculia bacterium]
MTIDGHRLRAAATIMVMSLAFVAAGRQEEGFATDRGAFAFHYSPQLTDAQLAWYSRFDVLVTHDPLPRAQVERLRRAGTRLLVYEWAVAFYESRARSWEAAILGNAEVLLNAKPLTGGVGSASAAAWYFDPAAEWHERIRSAELAAYVRRIGYDGVFFDTTTFESVHPSARSEYTRRRTARYDAEYSRFLARLRKEMPNGIIFTNQGYRSAEDYLPYVDWDLTESLITRPAGGRFELRPWNDRSDPWNSIRFLMENMIAPVMRRYPQVRFAHLNYITGPDRAATRVVSAVSEIFGANGYAATNVTADEIDPVYFLAPGTARSHVIDHGDGAGAHRFFERGLIAVRFGNAEIAIEHAGDSAYRDVFSGEQHCGGIVTLASGESPRAFFLERTAPCARALDD